MNYQQAFELSQNQNIRAFLDLIGKSEAADYQTLVHKGNFNKVIKDLSRHPNIVVKTTAGGKPIKQSLWSTAAGKYQFLFRTWTRFQKQLNLKDFTPLSQDLAAIAQLNEVKAIEPILKGDIKTAISRSRKIWASFPGAGYGQGEKSLNTLLSYYQTSLQNLGGLVVDNPGTSAGLILLLGLGLIIFISAD